MRCEFTREVVNDEKELSLSQPRGSTYLQLYFRSSTVSVKLDMHKRQTQYSEKYANEYRTN